MPPENALPPLIVITGPTATGKSALGVEVAKQLGGEIVSADSMLIYRYMNIGTAKPTLEERQGIPHYMIDLVNPDEKYSVALYQSQATKCIEDIIKRGKIPLLVGGTGLYIRALTEQYNFPGTENNYELRQSLARQAQKYGQEALHARLVQIDPATAVRLHPNDLKRVIRALEVYYLTGKPFSYFQKREQKEKYNLIMYGINMERQLLYHKIEERVDKMIRLGLVEEVQNLLNKGYDIGSTSLQGLGYKEIIAYLKGENTLAEAISLIKRNTRHFAKRQLTWFKRDKRILWLKVEKGNISEVAQKIAGRYKETSKFFKKNISNGGFLNDQNAT
jgi:tRNA dimethylallyltransferase